MVSIVRQAVTRLGKAAPILAIALWCGVIATAMALAAFSTTEPPVWDALSYVQKGYTFWKAIGRGKLFDPFALPMTVRPPGTILMSYPFGWSDNFHWFYFRSCFIPVILLVTAVYIAAWSRQLTRPGRWMLAGLALTLAGMPILYQFQANNALPVAASWGLVDGFLAGVCAIAAAAVVRGVAERSTAWSIVAAVAASFSLWIKPYGLALMALVGLAWLILLGSSLGWRVAELRRDAALRRFVIVSLTVAFVSFAVAIGLAFRSAYFSIDNIMFGRRVLTVLEAEFSTAMSADLALAIARISFGYAVPILFLLGLLAAARGHSSYGSAIVSLLCVLMGVWAYEPGQIRYCLPFGVMAFVLLLPALMRWLQSLKPVAALTVVGAAIVPTLIITALLLTPSAPDRWQRTMGISLHVNDFRAENEQAVDFLNQLRTEGKHGATVYFTDTTPALRNLVAVWDNSNVTGLDTPRVGALLPIDWQRATTIRADDLLHCDVIAVEFVGNETTRAAVLAQHQVSNFASLARLFNAWVSGLDEADGISVISDTRVRLARIVNRAKFEIALTRLEADYDLPQAYRDANPQRWWSASELAARKPPPPTNIIFHLLSDPAKALSLHVADVMQESDGLHAAFWLEPPAPDVLDGKWYIFGHLIDSAGEIVANVQVEIIPGVAPTPDRTIRYYTLFYPNRPTKAVALAFGIYKPGEEDTDFFINDQGVRDWEGRRVILPLPASR